MSKAFLANFGSKGNLANFGSGGPRCGLGPTWLPSLAPFGLIGLGQKGPKRPADCGTWPTVRGPRTVRTIGGLNGPRPPNEKGWLGGLETPRRQKGPPRPKINDEGLGVGEV
ncbi:hypothetical protein O181_132119 [Austropuccinia psidii MF-1]|uniref:Uncharacterized protein n=1 Tax=Austropuccinia psidii MF-1 TaxID=1389203 RepID=A0A9Q3L6U2_9BASI|nr:hypothetical protein [Austropuccinia psidii MF-1]